MARLLALASSYPRRRKRHTPANPSNAASTKSPGSLKVGICGTGGALCTVVDTLPALLAGFGDKVSVASAVSVDVDQSTKERLRQLGY